LRVDNDLEFLGELITLFREDSPKQMDKIRAALQLEDAAEVRRGAHSLRGALASLSAVSAATLAAEMEHSAEIGDLSRADAVFSNLAPELTRVIDALSAICEETVL
jgi:two-component system, sensor histidine kinase and response regulator